MFKKRLIRAISCLLITALVGDPGLAAALLEGVHSTSLAIPSRLGVVTETWRPTSPTASSPLVVLVQDLHANPGVQRNIAEILKSLAKTLQQKKGSTENRFLTVFAEGAKGPFDVSILRNVPNAKVKAQAVQKFLGEAKLTGAEVAAIESPTPMHLWGVDEKDLYLKNLQAFYQASLKSPSPIVSNPTWGRYYAVAKQRNIPMALNALSHLDLLNKTSAAPHLMAFIAGGYHTDGLTRILKANRIAYAVVTPTVAEFGHERGYAAQLRSLAESIHDQGLVIALGLAVVGFSLAAQHHLRSEILAFLASALPASTSRDNSFKSRTEFAIRAWSHLRGLGQTSQRVTTSGIKNLHSKMSRQPKVLFEGTLSEVIRDLEGNGKVNESLVLRDAYNTAMRRYPELMGLPIRLRITQGAPSIASIEGRTLVIEHFLLNHFELLRQELASEEFGHLLFRLLLEHYRPENPTPALGELAAEELHTDIKKLEDFLKIQSPEGQAALLQPLINDSDEGNFYQLLLRVLPIERRHAVIGILWGEGIIQGEKAEEMRHMLESLESFEGSFDNARQSFRPERDIIVSLVDYYKTHKTYGGALSRYFNSQPIIAIQASLEKYRQEFNRLRVLHEASGKPRLLEPSINLGGVEIQYGNFSGVALQSIRSTLLSNQELRLARGTKRLTIRRVNGKYLIIGNRTYALSSRHRVDLHALIYSEDPVQIMGNYDLIDFFGLDAEKVFSSPTREPLAKAGVHVYLYDDLQDPISPTADPQLVPRVMPMAGLAEARSYLSLHSVYSMNESLLHATLRLHYIAILCQSTVTTGSNYNLIMDDRIMVTNQLEAIARHTPVKSLADQAERLLWSISLLAIREVPERTVAPSLIMTTDELRHLEKKEPFVIHSAATSQAEFERLENIFAAQIKEGLICPYFIVNIQNFTPRTYLAYMHFLRNISEKYNGKLTFLLSLQAPYVKIPGRDKDYKPFDHDMPGTYTSRKRVIDTFGKDFYVDEYVANISDGGEKTRGANAAVRYEQWSRAMTSEGYSFLETNLLTAGVMWLMLPHLGQRMRLWLASDGKIQFGKINLGGKPLSELPSDFQMAAAGPEALVMTPAQRTRFQELIDRHGYWTPALLANFEFQALWADVEKNITSRKLTQRGIYVTNASGEMVEEGFKEKPSAQVIAEMALRNPTAEGAGEVIENIFFLIEDANVSYGLVTDLNRIPMVDPITGKNPLTHEAPSPEDHADRFLARKPVSVFQTVFQGFLAKGSRTSMDPVIQIIRKHISRLYGISYGEGNRVGDIGDLEQNYMMWQNHVQSLPGSREVQVRKIGDVTIRYHGEPDTDPRYLLRNVTLIGPGLLQLGDGVVIEGGSLDLRDNPLLIPNRTEIIDCNLAGPVRFKGEGGVLIGIDFTPGKLHEISGESPVTELDVYGDETVTQLDYPQARSYLVRAINSFPYKGQLISHIVGGRSQWGTIRARFHIASDDYERVKLEPVEDVVKNAEGWSELIRIVYSLPISDEALEKTVRAIEPIYEQAGSLSSRDSIQLISDLISHLDPPSARLTLTSNREVRMTALHIFELMTASSIRTPGATVLGGIERMIKELHQDRFTLMLDQILKEVPFDQVRQMPYEQALYRVLVSMHPRLLGIHDISEWGDIVRLEHAVHLAAEKRAHAQWEKEGRPQQAPDAARTHYLAARKDVEKNAGFIDLRNYGLSYTAAVAKSDVDALRMQERTSEARTPAHEDETQNTVIGNRGWFSYWAYYSGAKHVYEYAAKMVGHILGLRGIDTVVTRRAAFVKHPLFNPTTHRGWLHRARDAAIAVSSPLLALVIPLATSFLLMSYGPQSFPLHLLLDAVAVAILVPQFILGIGNLTAVEHPGSRIRRILVDLGIKRPSLEQPEHMGWADPRTNIMHRHLEFPNNAAEVLAGKSVLITGAGGNVARALIDQLLDLPIKELILFGFGEKSLTLVQREIEQKQKGRRTPIQIHFVLGNMTDPNDIQHVMGLHPQVVFHLAAYTDIPLIAANPRQGIHNNIVGTQQVLRGIQQNPSVERFVFVSSYQAAQSIGIYEKTKRIGELMSQNMLRTTPVRYTTVRFVNIWDGSPVFKDFANKVQDGQAVEIKSPEATRYYMRRDEAASLLLTAVSRGSSGDIFVPDTGKPVRIVDLAKMIIEENGQKAVKGKNFMLTGEGRGQELVKAEALHEPDVMNERREGDAILFQLAARPIDPAQLETRIADLEHLATVETISRDERGPLIKVLLDQIVHLSRHAWMLAIVILTSLAPLFPQHPAPKARRFPMSRVASAA